jgi:hypothetical protein
MYKLKLLIQKLRKGANHSFKNSTNYKNTFKTFQSIITTYHKNVNVYVSEIRDYTKIERQKTLYGYLDFMLLSVK